VATLLTSLTRRQFFKAGVLAVASLVLPPSPDYAASGRRLLAVPFHYQRHSLTCEIAALRMAAEYHGEVWAEDDLLKLMPVDKRQPRFEGGNLVWADPNLVFPGNFRGWQLYRGGLREHPERTRRQLWGYGLHAPAIADVAVHIGLAAELFDQVEAAYAAIDLGRVPIVIVPDGGRVQVVRWQWHTPQGEPVTVLNAEHSIVVRGYADQTVWVNDPKGKVWSYPRDRFERAFALLRVQTDLILHTATRAIL
jgi:hypothetical protein